MSLFFTQKVEQVYKLGPWHCLQLRVAGTSVRYLDAKVGQGACLLMLQVNIAGFLNGLPPGSCAPQYLGAVCFHIAEMYNSSCK